MEQDVPSGTAVPRRMPGPDSRPVKQLWDVHWSIVKQHVDAVRAAAEAEAEQAAEAAKADSGASSA